MIRDRETGNIEYVSYESYETMKEEYEARIGQLETEIEDLQDELGTKKIHPGMNEPKKHL